MSDAFDADVLIFIAKADVRGDSALRAIRASETSGVHLVGSVLLLPEVLAKPIRRGDRGETGDLIALLDRFDLKPVDTEIADAAVAFGSKYRLRAPDAIHLATAVVWGAERFHTNNRKDFGPHITEIDVIWPEAGSSRPG